MFLEQVQQHQNRQQNQNHFEPVHLAAEVMFDGEDALQHLADDQHGDGDHREAVEEHVSSAARPFRRNNRLAENDVEDERHHEQGEHEEVDVEQKAQLAPLDVKETLKEFLANRSLNVVKLSPEQHRVLDEVPQVLVLRDQLQRRDFAVLLALRRDQEGVIDVNLLLVVTVDEHVGPRVPSVDGDDGIVEESLKRVLVDVTQSALAEVVGRADVRAFL